MHSSNRRLHDFSEPPFERKAGRMAEPSKSNHNLNYDLTQYRHDRSSNRPKDIPSQHRNCHTVTEESIASTHHDSAYMMHGAVVPASPLASHTGRHNIQPKAAGGPIRPIVSSRPAPSSEKSAIRDVLPFCTSTLPLTETQVANLSNMAGSLREVMLIAMQAAVDDDVMARLQSEVGEEAAEGIVNFFSDEFQI